MDWRPFELHPDTPRGGILLREYFPEPRASQMREHLRQFSASFGLEPLESGERLSNTRRALAIAEYARDQGKLDAWRNAAMHAYWREHRELESDGVLQELAQRVGLDPKAAISAADDPQYQSRVDELSAEGRRRGVTGIPSFFIGPYFVVGCQPYEVLEEAVRRAGGLPRTKPQQ